ncbi:hypothetical protein [Streptomyces sp. 35G-GA-8]|nr:hypothetical protein [Streptomyces sp. 35G-GA-8]
MCRISRNTEPDALAALGAATPALWREIAEEDGTPWKLGMAD